MKIQHTILVLTALLIGVGHAAAQGANDCANAQAISGVGWFAFDNTSANTDGPHDCNGQPTRRDVWFDWTAPQTGDYIIRTCNGTNLDTRMVVYDGNTCPPTAMLACNSSSCGMQSSVMVPVVAGSQYLVRIGSRAVGQSGTGSFEIIYNPCATLPDDALEENDTCDVALPLTNGSWSNLFVSKVDADWYTVTVPEGGQLVWDVVFSHALGDIDIFLYDECGGNYLAVGGSASDNENITWDNTGTCEVTYLLYLEHWSPDTNAECNYYDMVITGAGSGTSCSVGTSFCSSTVNSTGMAAYFSASGTNSVSANNLVLEVNGMPNQMGIFFYGTNQLNGGNGIPLGNGTLCVGGQIFRFLPPYLASSNFASLAIDLTNPPQSTGQILAGSTWHFQAWFRDPPAGGAYFDFSDAYTIIFDA
jgi:hypothetical protein